MTIDQSKTISDITETFGVKAGLFFALLILLANLVGIAARVVAFFVAWHFAAKFW